MEHFKAGDIVRFLRPEAGEEDEFYEIEEAFYDVDDFMPEPRVHVRLVGNEIFSISPLFVMSPSEFTLATLPEIE